MGKIQGSHNELFHYTTAAGLSGILESKSLWATHASFVNDVEEILGFYDRVLPVILRPIFQTYIQDIKALPEFQKLQGSVPFEPYCEEQFEGLMRTFRQIGPFWHDHYITSFSTATDDFERKHGQLSQWRAYGPDGGYAIVFETRQLDKIVSEEIPPYQDEIYSWADVQYGLNANRRTESPPVY